MSAPIVEIPVQFQTLNRHTLQTKRHFASMYDMHDYATNDPTAVIGDHLRLVQNDVDKGQFIATYEIQFDRTLKLIGSGEGGGAEDATELPMGRSFRVTAPHGGLLQDVIITANDDVFSLLQRAFGPVIPPTYLMPSLALAGSTPTAGNLEFGTVISPTLNPTWVQGDGGEMVQYRLYREGETPPIFTNNNAQGHIVSPGFALLAQTRFRAQADFAQGQVLVDSNGNPSPAGRIEAGTTAFTGWVSYTPQRRAFSGRIAGNPHKSAAEWLDDATSAMIRNLTHGVLNPNISQSITVTVQDGDYGCVFCYPDTLPWPATITQEGGMALPILGAFAQGMVNVEGAAGSATAPYKCLVMINDAPYTANVPIVLRFT